MDTTFGPTGYGLDQGGPNESFSDLSFSSYGPGENEQTDNDLVLEYIKSKKKLFTQVEFFVSHKRKPQTDKSLASDYVFAINLHDTLLKKGNWPVSDGHILYPIMYSPKHRQIRGG